MKIRSKYETSIDVSKREQKELQEEHRSPETQQQTSGSEHAWRHSPLKFTSKRRTYWGDYDVLETFDSDGKLLTTEWISNGLPKTYSGPED